MTAPSRAQRHRHARAAAAGLVAAGTLLAAGCGSQAPPATTSSLARPAATTLNTSLATQAGTWAVIVMGGSAAQHNNFWQLFTRPAGSTAWKLVTPPGTADNGGLVLAADGTQSLITAFRPSQDLTYTPLIETGNGGRAWSSLSPLDAALASTPSSLAVQPSSAQLAALTTGGTAEMAAAGYTTWKILTSTRELARAPAGQRCRPSALTAILFTATATPVLGAACAQPGTAGIFAGPGGTWQAAGPSVPASLARQDVTVLRLNQTASGIAALLQAGSHLLAAWSADNGSHWTLSPSLQLGDAGPPSSASFGPDGTAGIVLPGNRGQTITPGGQWHQLPALPPGTAELTPGTGGSTTALAVYGATLTVWQLSPGPMHWVKAQVIRVPIQFGSSS
jgi:hypothetical protein